MDRISAIRTSLTAFICGIFALIPFLGVFPAVHALACWRAVRAKYHDPFNPAANYLAGGLALALVGLFVSLLATLAAILVILGSVVC